MSQNELNPRSEDYHIPLKLFCLPKFLDLLPAAQPVNMTRTFQHWCRIKVSETPHLISPGPRLSAALISGMNEAPDSLN